MPPVYTVIEALARPSASKSVRSTGKQQHYYGGVAIIYRSLYKTVKITSLPKIKSFEYVCIHRYTVRVGDVVVASIYRLGSIVVTSDFFIELTMFLESLATYRCQIILLSDFNIHIERSEDIHAKELAELLSSFDIVKHVDEATHNHGGCLDVVITRSDFAVFDVMVTEVSFSDHCLMTCHLPAIPPVAVEVQVKDRK